jgi:transcriptional repressor NrdR
MSIENFVNEIEDEAAEHAKISNEISTEALGDMVLRRLYDLDKVAYIRFASVYRKYETPDEFLKEIESLQKKEEAAR